MHICAKMTPNKSTTVSCSKEQHTGGLVITELVITSFAMNKFQEIRL
jgi:hypothetical protein